MGLDEVADTIRKLHRRYLEETNKRFAVALESAQGLEATGLPPQRSFWPAGGGGRRAVLVLDAFRFDLARELEEKLRSAGGQVAVELRALRAPLPSITPVGMASLLPLDGLEVDVSDGIWSIRPRGVDATAPNLATKEGRERLLASIVAGAVLAVLTGVQLTQGALTQDALRRTQGPGGTAYEALRTTGPAAPVVHTDDTGWRVGGEPAHLMAFETEAVTVSQIRPRHRHDEVQEAIPADYPGVMVTDRGRSYDAQAFDNVRQHKCLAHIQRSISALLATKTGRGRDFGEGLKALLQEALQWWHADHDGTATDFVTEAKVLPEELTYQRRDRRLRDRDHQRLLNELGWHHDRGHLVRFLTEPRVEPTNNRAERALRPAVIARTVSQCSKNGRGAYAVATFTSVVRTLTRQGIDSLVEGLSHLFRTPSIQGIPP